MINDLFSLLDNKCRLRKSDSRILPSNDLYSNNLLAIVSNHQPNPYFQLKFSFGLFRETKVSLQNYHEGFSFSCESLHNFPNFADPNQMKVRNSVTVLLI